MTILETPKEKPKRDQSRAFDLWLSKYPQLKPIQTSQNEWLFGEMRKDGKIVSAINFTMMPDFIDHNGDDSWGGIEWARNIDVETFLISIQFGSQYGVPLVHLLYFPFTDTLMFQTIWKDGIKTEVKFEENNKYKNGLAKVYFTSPKLIEGDNEG
jgi:hypothetical protein